MSRPTPYYTPIQSYPKQLVVPSSDTRCGTQVLTETDIANDGFDWPVSNPTCDAAIWISRSGVNRQFFDGEWH